MAGTNKTRGQDDISQELIFLRKQMYLDDPINALEKFNIAVTTVLIITELWKNCIL